MPRNLSVETLSLAKSQLEIVEDLSNYEFDNSTSWDMTKIPILYSQYKEILEKNKSDYNKLQQEPKKKKKDIEFAQYRIDKSQKYVTFLGNIIKSVNNEIKSIQTDIQNKMNNSDDF